ncbi:MAG: gamma-glutamyl-gamma-aminobutyrate hydrolase family protein, partial [Bacteroidota bacterium]|nr:gamma-glutamyl-gamma-aminobutyrate hydrolase family protein [Bacteroidota bacterium]
AGGKPIRVRPAKPRSLEGIHGLILGGGADIDPETYMRDDFLKDYFEQTLSDPKKTGWHKITSFFKKLSYPIIFMLRKLLRRKKTYRLDKDRDHLEFKLMDEAVKARIPILGICRGAQLINVYFEGDLYDDIGSFYVEEINRSSIFPVKKISLTPESHLAAICQSKELKVNALHHQAVSKLGNNIVIAAQEKNGIIQAIESPSHDFLIGVQWHPEYLLRRKSQRNLFRALVKYAKERIRPIASNLFSGDASRPG